MDAGSAVAPSLSAEAVLGLAAALLQRPAVPAASLLGMIQLCRQTGALQQARELLAKLLAADPGSAEAIALAEAFDGRFPAESDVRATPAPFVRRLGFLDPERRASLFDRLTAALPSFQTSEVDPDAAADDSYRRAARASRVLYDLGPMAEIFLPPLSAFLEATVYPLFGVDPAGVGRIELQATCHGDGGFFTAHTDADLELTNRRAISFVYYLHGQPRAFQGGDLILFDVRPRAGTYARNAYTRVAPQDNSLIVFPSCAVHEVQEVSLPDAPPAQGRLTINGWVRTSRPRS